MNSVGFSQCPICDATGPELIDCSMKTLQRDFKLAKCHSCGSMSSHPIPDEAFINEHYSAHFDYRWYADHVEAKRQDANERSIEIRNTAGHKILDLGGGLGYLSEALRGLGFDARTYDPFVSSSGEAPALGTFDSVICSHVLEHVPDPLSFLKNARDYLVPDGNIILSVPNASGAGYTSQGMKWVWAQPPVTHIHHFTPTGLTRLVQRAGFAPVLTTFYERWDANSESDITHVQRTRVLDGLWGLPMLNRINAWRALIGRANAKRRFAELRIARSKVENDENLAELCVVAKRLN